MKHFDEILSDCYTFYTILKSILNQWSIVDDANMNQHTDIDMIEMKWNMYVMGVTESLKTMQLCGVGNLR